MITLIALVLTAGGPVLFGLPEEQWIVTTREGVPKRVLTEVGGLKPVDLAMSPDERRWAVVTFNAKRTKSLHLVDETGKARAIPLPGDECRDPIFSNDGEWVFVSANDLTAPPLKGEPMRFVQLWRINFVTGAAEKLTKSRGCHMWPAPLGKDRLVFSHATCRGGRSFEVLDRKRNEVVLLPPDREFGEPVPSPDGRRIALWRLASDGIEFSEWSLKTSTERKLGAVFAEGARFRPAWHDDNKSLLYQSGTSVWMLAEGKPARELFQIKSARGTP